MTVNLTLQMFGPHLTPSQQFYGMFLCFRYIVERNCDTMQIGGLLDSKQYGIALPPGSPYR